MVKVLVFHNAARAPCGQRTKLPDAEFFFTFLHFYPKRLTYVRLTMYTHFTFTLMAHCTSGAIRGSVSCSRTLRQGIELATFDFSTSCTTATGGHSSCLITNLMFTHRIYCNFLQTPDTTVEPSGGVMRLIYRKTDEVRCLPENPSEMLTSLYQLVRFYGWVVMLR